MSSRPCWYNAVGQRQQRSTHCRVDYHGDLLENHGLLSALPSWECEVAVLGKFLSIFVREKIGIVPGRADLRDLNSTPFAPDCFRTLLQGPENSPINDVFSLMLSPVHTHALQCPLRAAFIFAATIIIKVLRVRFNERGASLA